jgi:TolA-binding protein
MTPPAQSHAPNRRPNKPALIEKGSDPKPDVASLFAQANFARRTHDSTQASALYQRVIREFPGSGEAQASAMALGSMALTAGDANVALQQFDAYLAAAPRGALAPDAWWGRSRALSALGRATEAQQSESELVRRFPDSPYATRARSQLGAAH